MGKMFPVIFIFGNLFFADRRKNRKNQNPQNFAHTPYIKHCKQLFKTHNLLQRCPFEPFLYLTCFLCFSERFERLHSLFLNKNIFQVEICEILRV